MQGKPRQGDISGVSPDAVGFLRNHRKRAQPHHNVRWGGVRVGEDNQVCCEKLWLVPMVVVFGGPVTKLKIRVISSDLQPSATGAIEDSFTPGIYIDREAGRLNPGGI